MALLRQKLEAVSRELQAATEEEYARLLASRGTASSSGGGPASLLQLSMDALVQEIQQQHAAQVVQLAPAEAQANILPLLRLPRLPATPLDKSTIRPEGTGAEVLVQGFNWDSWKHGDGWYNHVRSRAPELAALGFTAIWLPPPTQSVSQQVGCMAIWQQCHSPALSAQSAHPGTPCACPAPSTSHRTTHSEDHPAGARLFANSPPPHCCCCSWPQGYMPGDLYNLNSKYGTEAELRACVAELQAAGLKVLGDAVRATAAGSPQGAAVPHPCQPA